MNKKCSTQRIVNGTYLSSFIIISCVFAGGIFLTTATPGSWNGEGTRDVPLSMIAVEAG